MQPSASAPTPDDPHRFRHYPFAAQLAVVSVILYVAFHALVAGISFIIPIFLGLLFAFMLLPLAKWLERRGLHRAIASLLCVVVFMVAFASILGGLTWAVTTFGSTSEDSNQDLVQRGQQWLAQAIAWASETFGIPQERLQNAVQEQAGKLTQYFTRAVSALGSVLTGLGVLFLLVPFYIFTMLYFRAHWMRFFLWALQSGGEDASTARTLAAKAGGVARGYLVGELSRLAILSVLYCVGFALLGIPNWLVVGLLCGLLNIIPYVGTAIANFLPGIVVLLSGGGVGWAIGGVGWALAVQATEEYLILPKLVGSNVQLNPMVTLMASLLGLSVWGFIGMILFIPLTAILRITFAQFPKTRPYAFVLGEPDDEA